MYAVAPRCAHVRTGSQTDVKNENLRLFVLNTLIKSLRLGTIGDLRRVHCSASSLNRLQTPIITLDAFTIALTVSPCISPSACTLSLVIDAMTVTPPVN